MGRTGALRKVHDRLDDVERQIQDVKTELHRLVTDTRVNLHSTETNNFLELPKHLQVTLMAVTKLGLGTAAQIANITRKKRAVESSYLNQLCITRHLQRKREGRHVYFARVPKTY